MKTVLLSLLLAVSSYGFQTNYTFTVERLWDFSGTYDYSDDETDWTTTIAHGVRGAVVGSYEETESIPTRELHGTAAFTGAVKTTRFGVTMITKWSMNANGQYTQSGHSFHLDATVSGPVALNGTNLNGILHGRVCQTLLGNRDCKIGTVAFPETPLNANMTGQWSLSLDVTESGKSINGNATVTLSNGRSLTFTVTGRTAATKNTLRLIGNGDAIGTKLTLTTDPSYNVKKLTGKLMGQTVRVLH